MSREIPASPPPPGPLRVGLTGGIASGKSAAADVFARIGVPVIDTDEIAHELVRPDGPALAAILAAFGDDFRGTDGGLDRARMRARIFAEPEDRRTLEGILHPMIWAEVERRYRAEKDSPYQVLVVPLLVEAGLTGSVDRVLVIDCPPPLQTARLQTRDGASSIEATRILAAQASREKRLSAADDVLVNDGTLAGLASAVHKLHDAYLQIAAARLESFQC